MFWRFFLCFGLNCCTISCNISLKNQFFEPSRRYLPHPGSLLSRDFSSSEDVFDLFSSMFLICFSIFFVFFMLPRHAQSFRVCKVNLATLKVANNSTEHRKTKDRNHRKTTRQKEETRTNDRLTTRKERETQRDRKRQGERKRDVAFFFSPTFSDFFHFFICDFSHFCDFFFFFRKFFFEKKCSSIFVLFVVFIDYYYYLFFIFFRLRFSQTPFLFSLKHLFYVTPCFLKTLFFFSISFKKLDKFHNHPQPMSSATFLHRPSPYCSSLVAELYCRPSLEHPCFLLGPFREKLLEWWKHRFESL